MPEKKDCPDCDGDGTVDVECSECIGTGEVEGDCDGCNGTGKIDGDEQPTTPKPPDPRRN